MTFRAGSATRMINCEIGDDLCGQYHRRLCERIRDSLEANLFYLADEQEQVLLVSLDLAGLFESSYVRGVCAAIESETGIPARNVLLCSTHTHDGPDTLGLLFDSPKNETYLSKLHASLVEGAREAVVAARPARVGWASGTAHIGYNRRLCWADGTHTMYGDSTRPGFTGLEGPDDPSHTVLFAVDENGKLIALAHSNCCHATCMESATFASADFPGEARALLRTAIGAELPVLYLQGASGDVSPWDMMEVPRHHEGERRAREIGAALAAETFRLLHTAQVAHAPVVRHAFENVELAVRLPAGEALERAKEVVALASDRAGRVECVNSASILRLHDEFGEHPFDTLAVHAVRIGDYAIVTNPCELYCQFGLDIKRRSPAAVTAVAQLADGFSGYCPTIPALMGGGYSAEAIYWCRLEPYAGYKLVEVSARLLHQLWE